MTERIEVISPEGVEELLQVEYHWRITMTGGGKYRTYFRAWAAEPEACAALGMGEWLPGHSFETKKERASART